MAEGRQDTGALREKLIRLRDQVAYAAEPGEVMTLDRADRDTLADAVNTLQALEARAEAAEQKLERVREWAEDVECRYPVGNSKLILVRDLLDLLSDEEGK